MSKYSLGLDFGTLSVRAILLDSESGEIKATSVSEYVSLKNAEDEGVKILSLEDLILA